MKIDTNIYSTTACSHHGRAANGLQRQLPEQTTAVFGVQAVIDNTSAATPAATEDLTPSAPTPTHLAGSTT